MGRLDPVLAAALVAATFISAPAAAESAGVPCYRAQIVEVFAGTSDCPDADYVVVQAIPKTGGFVSGVYVLDHCGGTVGYLGGSELGTQTSAPYALIARKEAETLFGI